jgi:uncharacterized protein
MTAPFLLALFAVGVISGATASVLGFGIGSMLTPFLSAALGTPVAVAAVSIPHAVATGFRLWHLRRHVVRDVLVRFGLLSAAGGLLGALLYTRLDTRALGRLLGGLLVATAVTQLAGLSRRWRPRGAAVAALGLVSGVCGGVAGNQGGIRAAALASFGLAPREFVATATATALLVDVARTPVYLWQSGSALRTVGVAVAIATAGVVVGTLLGDRVLAGLPADVFSKVVAVGVGGLGLWLILTAA